MSRSPCSTPARPVRRRSLLRVVAHLGALALVLAAPRGGRAQSPSALTLPEDCSVTPPSAAARERLWSTRSDEEPEILGGVSPEKIGQHYYISDEGHADRFREYIAGAGGGYVGIGADQQYLYIGWARPQFAWTVDYDPHIVTLHRIHQAFFLHAATAAQWEALWQPAGAEEAGRIVEGLATSARDLRRLRKILRAAAPRMRIRLWRLHKNLAGVPTYLSDPPTYDFVRGLIRNGCVRPLLVDVTAKRGLAEIARAARDTALPIRTLYLSNAEEYWTYTKQFRANIRELPHDDRSRVLRTLSTGENHDYRYVAQPLANFVRWLDVGKARRSRSMIGRFEVAGPRDFPSMLFDKDPVTERAERAALRRQRQRRRSSPRLEAPTAEAPTSEAPTAEAPIDRPNVP